MPKFFPGVSHSVVKTMKDAATIQKMGMLATVRLCFADDMDNIIIGIKKMDGPVSGVTAVLPGFSVGTLCVPAIQGKVANEAKLIALMAFDQVKQKFGLKFNKMYRVNSKDVQEIGAPGAVNLPGVGA